MNVDDEIHLSRLLWLLLWSSGNQTEPQKKCLLDKKKTGNHRHQHRVNNSFILDPQKKQDYTHTITKWYSMDYYHVIFVHIINVDKTQTNNNQMTNREVIHSHN